jgi:hypothetical protein
MMSISRTIQLLSALFLLAGSCTQSAMADPQAQNFTYQGQLQQNGQPASGDFDLTFALFDAAADGNQQGATTIFSGYPVSGGLFTVSLSYPSAFTGNQLWLEVTVNGVTMSPRTQVATVPVAQYSLSGAIANGSITTTMLANGNVTRAKLAGASVSGNIGFSLGANACGPLTIGVGGAEIGDLAIVALGGATPPAHIIFGPASVTAANTVALTSCNISSSSYSNSSLAVTIQTFR